MGRQGSALSDERRLETLGRRRRAMRSLEEIRSEDRRARRWIARLTREMSLAREAGDEDRHRRLGSIVFRLNARRRRLRAACAAEHAIVSPLAFTTEERRYARMRRVALRAGRGRSAAVTSHRRRPAARTPHGRAGHGRPRTANAPPAGDDPDPDPEENPAPALRDDRVERHEQHGADPEDHQHHLEQHQHRQHVAGAVRP
jgi:hypothetical protein